MDDKPYLKYTDRFKKLTILNIILYSISILLVLGIIFLPIFVASIPVDLANVSIKDLEGLLLSNTGSTYLDKETGKLMMKHSFSLFDEVMMNLGALSSDNEYSILGILFMLFPLFALIMGGIAVAISIKQLISLISRINGNFETISMLEYSTIKKSTQVTEKKSFIKTQQIYSFIMFTAMSAIFTPIESGIYAKISSGISEFINSISYMANVKGISGTFALTVLMIAGYIVVNIMKSRLMKGLLIDITKEDYEKSKA